MKPKNQKVEQIQIDKDGSLGLLALGDVGLKIWREARSKYLLTIQS